MKKALRGFIQVWGRGREGGREGEEERRIKCEQYLKA